MLKQTVTTVLAALVLGFGSAFAAEKINLNEATVEQLQMLDGVGPATATAIIEYREANGGFEKVEELKNVKGIGEKKLQKLSEYVTVGK